MTAASRGVPRQQDRTDYLLLAVVAALILIGLQVVYSSTFALAITEYNNVLHFLLRQGIWACVGGILLLICLRVDYHHWATLSPLLLILALAALVLVLVPEFGLEQYGARRWLRLGPLPPIQPSEFVKLAVVIALAAWLSGPQFRVREFRRGLLPMTVVFGLLTYLMMREPDMGTTLVIMLTAGAMYFLAGANLLSIWALGLSGFAVAVGLIATAGYRAERLRSFIDPWQDPTDTGFHIIQLLIALGSGGFFGLGLGASRQKFFYIPGAHTDGVFAIIGEELGFLGCLVVLLLFAAVIYRGALIVQQAPDTFGALLAAGIISWIAFQTLINIGGITRTIPLTGIPLPFLSYGGSSLASTMAAIGILLNISRQRSASPPPSGVSGRR